MNGAIPVLAAGWADLIPIILAILFIVLPFIGQLLARERRAQQQQRPGQPAGKPRQGPLQDEIGEFLRRAAQNRGRRQPPQAARGGQPALPPRPAQAGPPRTKARRAQQRAAERAVEAEVIEARPLEPDRLAKQVTRDLNTSRFQRHAKELGEEVARADSRVEKHLHTVFDHQLGQLGGTRPSEPAKATKEAIPATAAAGLAAMLADAQTLRQAIVLGEILTRPEHRWE